MNTFRRFVTINDVDEAQALCELIQDIVFRSEYWDIAETFGCEFICDDHGEMIDPDFSPMIGTWWVHFEFDWDRHGDCITKYVLKIKEEIQSASEISTEYSAAKQYISDNNRDYEKLTDVDFRTNNKEESLKILDRFNLDKWQEMDKRRDLAAGDPNPYVDYTGLEEQWKYLA